MWCLSTWLSYLSDGVPLTLLIVSTDKCFLVFTRIYCSTFCSLFLQYGEQGLENISHPSNSQEYFATTDVWRRAPFCKNNWLSETGLHSTEVLEHPTYCFQVNMIQVCFLLALLGYKLRFFLQSIDNFYCFGSYHVYHYQHSVLHGNKYF